MELTADFGTIVNRKSAASFLMYADHWPRIVPRFVSLKNTRDLISPMRNVTALWLAKYILSCSKLCRRVMF